MRSTGTARKNSTTTPHAQRSARTCESRPEPKTSPKITAPTIANPAARSVFWRPGRKKFSHALAVKTGPH